MIDIIESIEMKDVAKMCTSVQVEDEFHTLKMCSKYDNIRHKLLSYLDHEFLLNNCDTIHKKFQFMLQAPNMKVAFAVSNYIKSCFDIRKSPTNEL